MAKLTVAEASEADLNGEILKTLYSMLSDPSLEVSVSEFGNVLFETEFHSIEVEEEGTYCNHKDVVQESEDRHGPTPDHPDTTVYFEWCNSCKTRLPDMEPDEDE